MSKLLYVISSPRGGQSESRAIADEFLDAYRQSDPGVEVDVLDSGPSRCRSTVARVSREDGCLCRADPVRGQAAAWAEVQRLFAVSTRR